MGTKSMKLTLSVEGGDSAESEVSSTVAVDAADEAPVPFHQSIFASFENVLIASVLLTASACLCVALLCFCARWRRKSKPAIIHYETAMGVSPMNSIDIGSVGSVDSSIVNHAMGSVSVVKDVRSDPEVEPKRE